MSGDTLEVLERPCLYCARKGNYELPGLCTNCLTRYVLRITKSHVGPGSMSGWACSYCGCTSVGVDRVALRASRVTTADQDEAARSRPADAGAENPTAVVAPVEGEAK